LRNIRKGDTVEVISGDDRGLRGAVRHILPKENRVIVSGVNIVKKHQRATPRAPSQKGIIELEAPIHISNVALVCPSCNQRTRVAFKVLSDGSKVRVCKKCNATIG